MRKLTISILFLAILVSLTACSGKDKPEETKPTLEVIQPTETETETLSDKLEETKSFTVPTIGTTEATGKDGEEETVGITETLEDDSYIAVLPDDDVMVTMNVPELSSGHEYTESEAIAIEGLIQYWSENNISKDILESRLEDEVYSGLSENDKAEIVNSITSANPHNNPTITEEVQETEVETEVSNENLDTSWIDEEKEVLDKYFGGENGELSVTPDPNLNLISGN